MRKIPRSVGFAFLLALALLLSFVVWRLQSRPSSPTKPVPDDAYVGYSRDRIIQELGKPSQEFDGHYGLVSAVYATKFSPATTLVYDISGGTLYISIRPQLGVQTCFVSTWVPTGTQF